MKNERMKIELSKKLFVATKTLNHKITPKLLSDYLTLVEFGALVILWHFIDYSM